MHQHRQTVKCWHTHPHTHTASYARRVSKRAGDGAIHTYTHTHALTSFVSLAHSHSCASLSLSVCSPHSAEMSHCRGDSRVGCLSVCRSFGSSVCRSFIRFVCRSSCSAVSQSIGQTLRRRFFLVLMRSTLATMQCDGNGTFQLL